MTRRGTKYGTATHTDILWAGVIKPERGSTAPHRMSLAKMAFNGAKGARSRHKGKYPITLPTKAFDFQGDDQ